MDKNVQTQTDHWIKTSKGNLFAREWLYEDVRTKAPIILFHDSLGCIQLWRDFPATLSKVTKRNVIAYDRLGFGKSDPQTQEPHIDFITEEAEEFFPQIMKAFGLDQFIAFGHSVGGAMAILCARQCAEKCRAVISESTQAFVERRTLEGISAAKKNFEDPSQLDRIKKYHGDKALWVLKAWTDVWLSPEFSSWSLKDVLPQVRSPLLTVHGDNDEYGSLVFPESIFAWTGGPAEKLIIPACGHVPHKEKEEFVLEKTADFLARNVKD